MTYATDLLARASALYDDPQAPFAIAARDAWQGGFASGAEWMRLALACLRGRPMPDIQISFQQLGLIKYGLAACSAVVYALLVGMFGFWALLPGAAFIFYAVEAQMVFLFPLALDGCQKPFRAGRAWTQQAGGTLPVTFTVMQLALVMLFGGFFGHGFVRCWCLGCLAVLLWYEDVPESRAYA